MRVATVFAFGVLPVLSVILLFRIAWGDGTFAVDFHNEIYPEAKELLAGNNPFPGPEADLSHGSNFIWPPFIGYLAVPLTLFAPGGADITIVVLGLLAFLLALWIVDVRDWRVYGASFLWVPVIGDIRTAHVTLFLCLLVALAWRFRDRLPIPGLTLGVAIALKFFLWPLVLWLAATRRWRDAAIAAIFSLATLVLLLPFISLPEYARLLRRLGADFDQDSFTPFGLLVQAGAPERPARVIGYAIAIAVLAIAWRRQSFVLIVAAAILLSPIVWLDYFALIAIPLAVVQPRLSVAWVLPILLWGITSGGAGAGHVEPSIRVLAVFTAVTILVARSEGRALAERGLSGASPATALSTSWRTTPCSCSCSAPWERSSSSHSPPPGSSQTPG
jgi:hypothetical protein